MVNFKKLTDKAKDQVDKRGGTDALKEDAGRAQGHRQGQGQPQGQGQGRRQGDQGARRQGRGRRPDAPQQ